MSNPRWAPTRRQFTLVLAGAAPAFAGTRNQVYNPMLAAHTSVWRAEMALRKKRPGDILDEALTATKRAGYRRTQMIAEFLSPPLVERTLARLGKVGLELSIVCAGGPMHTKEAAEESRAAALATAQRLAGAAGHIGFTIPARPDGKPKTDDELRMQAYQVNRLGEEVARTGMGLILEHEEAEMRHDAREWRRMLAQVEPRLAGFCLDLDRAASAGANPWTLIEAAGGRLRSLHIRNTTNGRAQETLKDGDINMAQIASLLRAMQYDGFLVVELADDLVMLREHTVANALSLSRSYAHLMFGSRPGAPAVDMGPHARIPR